jgi:hypothetical protein
MEQVSRFFHYPFHNSRINLLSRAVRQSYLAQAISTMWTRNAQQQLVSPADKLQGCRTEEKKEETWLGDFTPYTYKK